MNGKMFVLGLGAVLLCTTLVAHGADPAGPTASVTATKAMLPQATATMPEAGPRTCHKNPMYPNLASTAVVPAGLVKKNVGITTPIELRSPLANDDCENAEVVTGPYPATVCGTNEGAGIDCPGNLDWEAVWYEVALPYEFNDLVANYCAGAVNMGSDEIGVSLFNDCSCGASIVGAYGWNDCGNGNFNPTVVWRQIPGPATVLLPVYINPAHEFCVELNVNEAFPCFLDWPVGGMAESEACGEDVNNGCNMPMPAFEPLTCGDTICGTCWAMGGARDTDWFEITVDEPTTMTFTVKAEFVDGVTAGLLEPYTPGVVGCSEIAGYINPFGMAGPCEETTIVYNAHPGTYWWFVGPTGYDGMPCGSFNEYHATMTCETWELRGACCDEDTGTCLDNVLFQDCAATARFEPNTLCENLSPPCGGCPERMLEIEIRTDRYSNDTTWTITDHNDPNTVVCSGGPYEESGATYFEYCCIGADDCVDFTIHDLSGDGMWPPQGYAVRLDGVELCSTIGNGWSGYEQTCNNLGVCELGRCCYSPWPNCVDATLFDCIGLYNGEWSEGMNCTNDACRDPDVPDFEVVAPYTSPERSTCGGLNRCHSMNQSFDTQEHVYLVTIPYDGLWMFSTCQNTPTGEPTWISVGTSICGEDIGWNAWACNGFFAEVAAHVTAGDYYVTVQGYQQCVSYILNVYEVIPCEVDCPAGSTQEVEVCGEATNNGCWGYPVAFESITCNQPICGTSWADSWNSDNDWFEFVAPADDTMTFTAQANFPFQVSFAQQYEPGVPGCENFTGGQDYAQGADCGEASVTFPVTAGGTYYMIISYLGNFNGQCGTTNDYVVTLTGSNCICGDFDNDNDVDYADYVIFLSAFGGPVDGNPAQDAACDFDGSGAVGLADYQAWLDCYRTFVGDEFAGPPSAPGTLTPTLGGQSGLKKKSLPAAGSAGEAAQPAAGNGNAQPSGRITKLSR